MPARRLTAAEREFHGTARRNPARYPAQADSSSLQPLGNCPRHLTLTQKTLWRQLVACAPTGLLRAADEFAIELVVRLIERSRTATDVKASEVAALANLLGKLGLTPADRARLDLPAADADEANEFNKF